MKKTLSILLFPLFLLAACSPLGTIKATLTKTLTPTSTRTPRPTGIIPTQGCLQRAQFGDPALSPYILPYPAGTRHTVGQAYCTIYTHSNQLAYGFDMRVGEKVTAARAGKVVKVVEYFPDSATGDQEFNYVLIRHVDGTVAFYAHLKQYSIVVEVGDQVSAGELIALAGSSGMPRDAIPCLHFGVYAGYPPVEGRDVAVNFKNAYGRLDDRGGLAYDRSYLALPWWEFWRVK